LQKSHDRIRHHKVKILRRLYRKKQIARLEVLLRLIGVKVVRRWAIKVLTRKFV